MYVSLQRNNISDLGSGTHSPTLATASKTRKFPFYFWLDLSLHTAYSVQIRLSSGEGLVIIITIITRAWILSFCFAIGVVVVVIVAATKILAIGRIVNCDALCAPTILSIRFFAKHSQYIPFLAECAIVYSLHRHLTFKYCAPKTQLDDGLQFTHQSMHSNAKTNFSVFHILHTRPAQRYRALLDGGRQICIVVVCRCCGYAIIRYSLFAVKYTIINIKRFLSHTHTCPFSAFRMEISCNHNIHFAPSSTTTVELCGYRMHLPHRPIRLSNVAWNFYASPERHCGRSKCW